MKQRVEDFPTLNIVSLKNNYNVLLILYEWVVMWEVSWEGNWDKLLYWAHRNICIYM